MTSTRARRGALIKTSVRVLLLCRLRGCSQYKFAMNCGRHCVVVIFETNSVTRNSPLDCSTVEDCQPSCRGCRSSRHRSCLRAFERSYDPGTTSCLPAACPGPALGIDTSPPNFHPANQLVRIPQ